MKTLREKNVLSQRMNEKSSIPMPKRASMASILPGSLLGAERGDYELTATDVLKVAWRQSAGSKWSLWKGVLCSLCLWVGLCVVPVSIIIGPTQVFGVSMGSLVLRLLAMLILPPLTVGLLVMSAQRVVGRPVRFKTLFAFFGKSPQLFLVSVSSILPLALGLILGVLPGLFLVLVYLFALVLVVDRGLTASQALRTSFISLKQKWVCHLRIGIFAGFVVASIWLPFLLPLLMMRSPSVFLASIFLSQFFSLAVIWTIPLTLLVLANTYIAVFGIEETTLESAPLPPVATPEPRIYQMGTLETALKGGINIDVQHILNEAWERTLGAKWNIWKGLILIYWILLTFKPIAEKLLRICFQHSVGDVGPDLLHPMSLLLVSVLVLPPFSAGLTLMAVCRAIDYPQRLRTLFSCLKKTPQLVFVSLISNLLITVGLVLGILPGIYFMIAFQFAPLLVVEKNIGPIEALQMSRRVSGLHLSRLLPIGLAMIGAYMPVFIQWIVPKQPMEEVFPHPTRFLIFGLVWLAPWSLLVRTITYRNVFGIDEATLRHDR